MTEKDLQEINTLEKDIHSPLLAFSCNDTPIAELSADKLKKIQALEKNLESVWLLLAGSADKRKAAGIIRVARLPT